ncbi:MAG: RagB/SusD family nutrient uptake outer membrane protein [Bacteroidales bacterium]|nr:RagB/SusD family nutrient uptake outer membrane protein [Bacteroidales bacterium]
MLKTIKHIVLVAGAIVLAASCGKNYLVTPPAGELSAEGFYNTPAHIESGVLGVYSKLQGVENYQYLLFSEDRSDNVWVDSDPNGIRTCSESSFFRINDATGEISGLWAGWYSLIYNANTILANIDAVEFTSDAVKNQFKGEVLFLRALAHFELVRAFSNVPIVDHVLSSAEAKENPQSSGDVVINTIVIPDLKEAESLLPLRKDMKSSSNASISGSGRADKLAAQALLGRVYMTLAGYPYNDASAKANAKSYLKTVVENGSAYFAPTIKDWKKMFLTDNVTANKYQIFAIQHTLSNGNQVTFESGVAIKHPDIVSDSYHSGSDMSPVYPEGTLKYEFEKENDPRGLGFSYIDSYPEYAGTPAYSNRHCNFQYDGTVIDVLESSINTKWCPTKPKLAEAGVTFDDSKLGSGTSSRNMWPLNFPILRYEDMMLLYAELLCEDNSVAEAMALVNKIRNRAGITPVPSSCTKEEGLKYVERERKLELYLEGVRWFDMVRHGNWKQITLDKYTSYDYDHKRTNVNVDNVKDGRYLLPIPKSEMAAVPGLYNQNKDYE